MITGDKNYEALFSYLVSRLEDYVVKSHVKCMVLGVSGGIDSTLVAAIGRTVSMKTGIPLLGSSLSIKNKDDEKDASILVGEAFCTEFEAFSLGDIYKSVSSGFKGKSILKKESTPISEGNLMARLRMTYLYDLAGTRKGLVLDTDNLTEHNLGFWTIHGDEGDYNPIGGLWKTEVYGLAEWFLKDIKRTFIDGADYVPGLSEKYDLIVKALETSLALTPTDGNGISSSDLEQIGGKSYFEVDEILVPIVEASKKGDFEEHRLYMDIRDSGKYSIDTVDKIYNRFCASKFKRLTSRTIKVERKEILDEIC